MGQGLGVGTVTWDTRTGQQVGYGGLPGLLWGGRGLGGVGGSSPTPQPPPNGAEVFEAPRAPKKIFDWPKVPKKIWPNLLRGRGWVQGGGGGGGRPLPLSGAELLKRALGSDRNA